MRDKTGRYTWHDNQSPPNVILRTINWAITNSCWLSHYTSCKVNFLPRYVSDHNSIALHFLQPGPRKHTLFMFFNF